MEKRTHKLALKHVAETCPLEDQLSVNVLSHVLRLFPLRSRPFTTVWLRGAFHYVKKQTFSWFPLRHLPSLHNYMASSACSYVRALFNATYCCCPWLKLHLHFSVFYKNVYCYFMVLLLTQGKYNHGCRHRYLSQRKLRGRIWKK